MKELKPIIDKDSFSKSIEDEIVYYLYSLIYKAMVDFLNIKLKVEIKNSKNSIIRTALESGKIRYDGHKFTGNFNARLSAELRRLGAKFNKPTKSFNLSSKKLPMDVRASIAVGEALLDAKKTELMNIMSEVERSASDLTYKFDFSDSLSSVFQDLEDQTVKTLKPSVRVLPQFTKKMKENLIRDFNQNVDLSIKKFQQSTIEALRADVQKEVFAGFRADRLERIIMNKYATTASKARFLARQESSLLVSKYREQRYKDAGIEQYRWSTSKDSRVRDRHRHLQGKVFDWSNPPITDEVGNRNHPGEDYGCRCIALPILN